MYGYITPDGTVGELFEAVPPQDKYHADFLAAITELPEGVTTGWRRADSEWRPPEEPETPGVDTLEVLAGRIAEFEARLESLESEKSR